ncbi:2Fe-2S iron-sulfur cluster binding domain-containing protein [Pseudomonas lalucatii]|uniref:2Fe-2S iron-sulfur cluster binding domain-containing protein n=1 Tax=Pseudomonas lalucatii TaxID=1424203 RepID=A0ABS5PY90_9PSED|nr:phenol 2-monooxygenase domain-containing protein [Pseudomonas lalucatii]MBS7661053.1 2Fe-2S iron-sulfur cluster binding domain-containing protein [Pseudomonas lalucatii]MBS7724306.1 2Fe-2S iron-sulfur cluster binding domain-containing protein [Pseudomonas lalucatii]QVM87702.1 2Fe-2S iron-sulfur cluster binding domain-containing protein [Pseudomonas lalucatii]
MTYNVTIEPTGEVIEVEEGQTILQAALRQGVWLPFACGHGTCATCKVQVLDGDVEVGAASPFALMDIEREEGKVLACCATVQSDVTIEADIDVDPDFLGHPVADFHATVTAIVELSPTIKGVHLRLDRPMAFQSGQYVNLELPGIDGSRAFSLANPPGRADEVELHVRLVEGGAATGYIHQQLKVGERLKLSGPYGQFFVRGSQPGDLIFIAGGSGLSSPQSMILDLLERGDSRQITLFQGARNVAELYNRELFEGLAREHANFTYVPALSQANDEPSWRGFKGFVHDAAKAHFDGRFGGHKAYLCGPPPMIDAAISTLMQGRLFERDIFMERFLTAADGAADSQRSALFKRI